jgi:phospholipid/cholesterol/gamma-HCH transport system permease protein
LTILADLVGIAGGVLLAATELNIHPAFYFHEAIVALRLSDFMVGFGKTFVFGLIISFTACYYGLNTQGGTQGVGQATTKAVVTSSILITISDFILTKVFWLIEKGLK